MSFERGSLIRFAHARAKQAMKKGFCLEVIALCDSLIGDRLESTMVYSAGSERLFLPLGQLVHKIRKADLSFRDASLLSDCEAWSRQRNACMHEFAKLRNGYNNSWTAKLDHAKQTATGGLELVKRSSLEAKWHKL